MDEHAAGQDLPLKGYDAIEFWVGNAKQAAHFYRTAFGFKLVGYAGPETGVRDRASYVLQQRAIRFVLTTALTHDHEITRHQARHGDGVRDVAFRVPDAEEAFAMAVARGATAYREPESARGRARQGGPRRHPRVRRHHPLVRAARRLLGHVPARVPAGRGRPAPPTGGPVGHRPRGGQRRGRRDGHLGRLLRADHGVQPAAPLRRRGHLDRVHGADVEGAVGRHGRIKLPINEPAEGKKKSQIDEYLQYYGSPGVQHLALSTGDIVATVRQLRDNGVRFLTVPDEYYRDAKERVGTVDESWDDLQELGILVDRDDEGYLLQIFTEPVEDRPTVFYEVIERHGAKGFGVGNFKALFESIERAPRSPQRRGNL
jgi:4-hydroxyphenylpyruvate dioxygenase